MPGEKKIIIIAGPNGAGKTTFAREFLPREAGCPDFIEVHSIEGQGTALDNHRVSRRNMLRTAGLALAGTVIAPAALGQRKRSQHSPPYTVDPVLGSKKRPRRFAPVNVARERVIRTVVGLRPFRQSGFVVRAESLGDKLLVHNYGHGGAGMTLSWGTAQLAADLISESGKSGPAAVIGCGVIGLSTARTLQRRGFAVTIYAKSLPPETTSNISGASWSPTSIVETAHRTSTWDAQFERAARIAHRAYQLLIGDEYGVRWREQYYLTDDEDDDPVGFGEIRDLFPDWRRLDKREHPFPTRYAVVENLMFIEPSIYLNTLLRDFYIAGGRIRNAFFMEPGQLGGLSERIVVNCTGLGARELFGDRELTPVKGQLTVLLPQPEVDYAIVTQGLYMFPRKDGIMLGGTFERGVETLTPNPEAEERILSGHQRIFSTMK
ncbi:MAG: FAD-dependent oxidoreductase [Blastocatellia bacterium AA13]|nr:MAG: FAD-dependent oxidoreductase [Blastocatellia bacterium AA13]